MPDTCKLETLPVSTARKPAKLRTKADYLIIGGGIAGMAALAEARRIGIDAICLEARTKPGGRIRTERNRRMANYPIELGPEFVHGPLMKGLCESLGLTLVRHPSDGAAFVDKKFLPLLPILRGFKTIRERAAAHLAAGKEDCSVEEFLASLEDGGHDPLQELESPEDDTLPQLFFAGDYVTRHPGSVHSAYQSGIDAVRRSVILRKTE
jgi:phytoene dehydrogenase-like protein